MNKYTVMQKKEEVVRNWYEIDAEGKILGKLAAEIAVRLMGKNKVSYTPHVDGGDFVVVTNADKFVVTGNKMLDKKYYRHSGYPGGLKTRSLEEMLDKVAVYYENEVDNAVDGLTSLMEPLIMAVLGVLIGGLVIAMYLPIFQMGAVVG